MSDFPVLMPVYNRTNLYFERGEGVYLWDDKGQRYLDFVAGIAVVSLGHCNSYVTEALKKQSETLWTVSNLYNWHSSEKLAQRLVDLTFADTVFFQNSGAEAWECGVKTIRKYFSATGQPERFRIIGFEGCFHGRTMTAIAASKSEKMVGGFGPLIDGFDLAKWEDIESVKALITPETAAIMIEPILGEGGVKLAHPEFLSALRRLCDEKDLLLFFDEIQCGMGRTGKLFAHQWTDVTPDVMCVAKALGNGYPIGACLATAKAARGMTPGTHGSTYGGNPLAMAVGNAVLDIITEQNFLTSIVTKSIYLEKALEKLIAHHPRIFTGIRGQGLMRGIVCGPNNIQIVQALIEQKLLTVVAGENVIRLLPPLIVSEQQIDDAIVILDKTAAMLENAS